MLVRKYKNSDCQAIADIYNQAIIRGGITMDERCYSAQDIQSIVHKFNERETILIGEHENRIIGWGKISRYSDRLGYSVCCETSIYLSCLATGQGYGSTLQTVLLTKAVEFNYHHVVAKITAVNQSSIKFHQKFGFEIVGIQKEIGFMRGSWYDVVIMQLLLPHQDG